MDIDVIASKLAESGWTLLSSWVQLYSRAQEGTENEEDGMKLQLAIKDSTWNMVATATRLKEECNQSVSSEVLLAAAAEKVSLVFAQFFNNRGGDFEELKVALRELTSARRGVRRMPEESKRVIHTEKYIERIEGSYHEHNYYAQKQNLTEAAAEIQKLLDQLAKTSPNSTEATLVQAIQVEIKRNPTLKTRLINALKSGGVEALKAIFNHPLVSVPVETIKGFLEAEAE